MNSLRNSIHSMERKGYPAYKALKGEYQFTGYRLDILHVQGDPFASPSSVSVKIAGEKAGFPKAYYEKRHLRVALEDFLLRQFSLLLAKNSYKAKGSGKSGLMAASQPGQEVLERTGCRVLGDGSILFRFVVGFPARGRSIDAGEMEKIFFTLLPPIVEKCGFYANVNQQKLKQAIELAEDWHAIREQLKQKGLAAFVANGAILPRESGVSEKPMKNAVLFQSPKTLEITMELPYKGVISGMGIKEGVTLIVGGGYHGKSTLLKTLEKTVYSHIAGDGREYTATLESGMKIRAEDHRSVCDEDISLFIRELPNGKNTVHFSTLDASGSTSQAANIMEAIEAGSRLLLIDEDTSATNFMIRDELMEQVVSPEKEPIIPFIKRIRPLYEQKGISTILAAGSCGAFFEKAETIIQMDSYLPKDITEKAKAVIASSKELEQDDESVVLPKGRTIKIPKLPERSKIKVSGTDGFSIHHDHVNLRYLEQTADGEQMSALAHILCFSMERYGLQPLDMEKYLDAIMHLLEEKGMEGLIRGRAVPNMAMPRRNEIAGCINRYLRADGTI